MFGLSFWEIALILAVGLIVLGPKKLPEIARKLGEGLREFRSATQSFSDTVNQEAYRPEAKKAPEKLPPAPEPVRVIDPTTAETTPVEEAELMPAEKSSERPS